jgi:hypothetical protein
MAGGEFSPCFRKRGDDMKSSGKGKKGTDRKQFLGTIGAATVGAAGLDGLFISKAFGAVLAVQEVPKGQISGILSTAPSKALHPEHFSTINSALNSLGLTRADDVARVYKVATKTLTILPYHPSSKTDHSVGAVAISEGSPMSAVSVKLNGTKVVSYTTHDVFNGKLVEKTIAATALSSQGVTPFVEKRFKRYPVTPDVSVETSADISEQTFRKLLADEQSKGMYSAEQVRGFLTNVPTIRLMAQLQYARHKGLKMSKVNACCSTCSCCWGCCSCTSAASSSYLSEKYRSRSASRRIGT